jgi:hypothetical protein
MELCGDQCACMWGPETPVIPRQGISGSQQGGYNLSNSKIIVLYVQLIYAHT